ncbi:spore germination protein [Fictibacillus nanhaiensis]|uniref:spore germination protein n=1 Tax=Fictibacillus nanhaiensis TaxID=742169 RepID=UPI002E1F2905|nr:spore germination protein [Fictibacillus nanhaiensis]MED1865797.1 spore germination protein [Fictibacillus nanhaiensis]
MNEIESKLTNQADFLCEEMLINQTSCYLIGMNSLVDFPKSKLYIQQMVTDCNSTVQSIVISISDQINVSKEEAINAVLEGKLVIVTSEGVIAVINPVSQNLNRSIEEPKNESPIQASMNAFGEDININVGLIRKRLNTERLQHLSYQTGNLEKRKISMLYIKGHAPDTLIDNVKQRLEGIKYDIETIDDLNKQFEHRRLSPVSHLSPTELPIQAIHALKKNRIVIFIDNYPFALIFPNLVWDMLSAVNDRNFPFVLTCMLRVFRVIGALSTIILPALYVALVSVNPGIFRTDLALFVAKSREGIPLSAFLETILMVVIVDLILEAITRLPKSVGPAITMVGGVILGQAMVEAKLVSNLLVIVITAVVIASSAVIGMQNSLYIRLLKYPILILASFFGILGVCAGLIFTLIYLASLESEDISYLTFYIEPEGES